MRETWVPRLLYVSGLIFGPYTNIGTSVSGVRMPFEAERGSHCSEVLSEANDVLTDPKKRKIYDQLGFYSDNIDPAAAEAYARGGPTGAGGFGGFPGGQVGGAGQGVPFDFGGFDFSDLFEGGRGRRSAGGGGSFRDIFSGMFSGRGGAAAEEGPEPGSDLEYQVNVPFWTAIRG